MVIGPVETTTREPIGQPGEKGAVTDVHAEGDLGLLAVATEGPFPHQNSHQQAGIKGLCRGCFTVRYHVKQRTCFTVRCHVKHARGV